MEWLVTLAILFFFGAFFYSIVETLNHKNRHHQ